MTEPTGTRASPRLRSALLVVWAAAAPGLAGCDAEPSTDDSGRSGPGVTVRDSAGIEIVENHAPQRAKGQFWTMDPEPTFVLGGIATGAESDSARDDLDGAIWAVRGLAMLVDGRIAVLSQGHHRVFIFDKSGRLSRQFGGRGEGPGEFALPVHLQYLPPDTLAVWDQWLGPVTYFDTTGAVLRRQLIDAGRILEAVPGATLEDWTIPLPGGSFLLGQRLRDPGFVPPEGTFVRYPPVELVRVGLETYVPRSLGTWDGPEEWVIPGYANAFGMGFPRLVSHKVAAGGPGSPIYVTNGDRDEISQFSPDGILQRIIRRTTAPVTVTPEADRSLRDHMLRLLAGQPDDTRAAPYPRAVEEMAGRDHFPPMFSMVVDVDGFLWVGEWSKSESGIPDQWSVFGRNGRWVGILDDFSRKWFLPCHKWTFAVPCWIDRDWMVTVTVSDEVGLVERIEAYRIHRDGEGQ